MKHLNKYIIMLTLVISGIFGFIYETIFYKIDLGYFIKRGQTYGPWVPLYSIGALIIILLLYKYKNKPIKIFILSMVISGIIEYIAGALIYNLLHIRLWDYNKEILNFLNINGYICLRSLLFFGMSSLLLIYIIIPTITKIYNKTNKKIFNIITNILFYTCIIDLIIHTIINYLI